MFIRPELVLAIGLASSGLTPPIPDRIAAKCAVGLSSDTIDEVLADVCVSEEAKRLRSLSTAQGTAAEVEWARAWMAESDARDREKNARMASEERGPEPTRALEPPGFLGLNYGRRTPFVVVLSHMAYGTILGSCYRLAG